MLSHMPQMMQLFNKGFDKVEEIRIEASQQSRTRDNHRLARMKDKDRVVKFEAKSQNARVNKDINKVQRDACNFERRRLKVETF